MTTLLLLSLFGCTSPGKDDSGTPNTTDDSGTTDTVGDPEITGFAVTTAEGMSSVFIVEWDTSTAGTSWVEYGPDASYGLSTVPSAAVSTHHKVVVAGAPFGAEWHFRAASELDGTTVYSGDHTHDGGQKPAGLMGFDMEKVDTTKVDAGIRVIPYFTSVEAGIMVVNVDGDLVWHLEFEHPESTVQAQMTADGLGLLYMIGDVTRRTDIGEIRYTSWDLATSWAIRAEWAHHDFQLLPDGSFAFLAADIREQDGNLVAGDAVVRMDADGSNARTIWTTWDHLEVPDFTDCRPTYYPDYCDWTHVNGLWYEASDDTFAVSIHNDNTVLIIDAEGTPQYGFGSADYADVQPASSDDVFVHQHGVERIAPDRWALFDNGEYPPAGHSRALVLDVDRTAGTYASSWVYDWDTHYSSTVLGDHDVLPNGNHLLSWGSEAVITEVTDDASLPWELAFDLGTSCGFVSYEASSGGVTP